MAGSRGHVSAASGPIVANAGLRSQILVDLCPAPAGVKPRSYLSLSESIPGSGSDGERGNSDPARLLEAAREIADTVLRPRANATDRAGTPPIENIRLLAEAGLLGLTTPTLYGGHGAP